MKTNTWLLLAGAFLMFFAPQAVMAGGACTAARFHDWQDCGCNQNHPGAGGPPTPKTCSDCDHGMPRWWISEPYINLHISDTPLSYKMSSGGDMSFQLFYRIRPQVPLSDESPITTRTSPYDVHYTWGANCGTNAYWNNNWNMSVLIQATGNNVTPAFSQGYSALAFRPDGGVENYTNGIGTYAKNPSSQVTIQDVSGLGYPLVEETYAGSFTNKPTADSNGIFWGDSNVGVKLVYPDGSQDVFGLSAYPVFTVNYLYQVSGIPQMRLLLTQRISPQGRVTSLGYEYVTFTNWWSDNGPTYGKPDVTTPKYRLRYVVDEDGRTNTFVYNKHQPTNSYSISHTCFEDTSSFVASNVPARDIMQVVEIDDPFGRKVQFGYDLVSGILTNITDAAGLTTYFQYDAKTVTNMDLLPDPQNVCQAGGTCQYPIVGMGTTSGWITNLITPYGSTAFRYYELGDSTVTEGVQQRAIYVSEPTGAHQLYYYLHKGVATNGTTLLAQTAQAPTVPGVSDFDDGTGGGTHPTLEYRNTIYWGRRQFAVLSASVQNSLPSNVSNALASLTANDFRKGRVRNWLWQPDSISISECLGSERDPSPDSQGQIEALRTWYDYPGKIATDTAGASPQISCIARLLPDGASQYTTYNYYRTTGYPLPAGSGLLSDTESTYTKPDGSIGLLTNWFAYANNVDLSSVSNSAGQYIQYGYNGIHQVTYTTNALRQVTSIGYDGYGLLTSIQLPSGEGVTLNPNYWDYSTDTNGNVAPGPNYLLPSSIVFSPSGRCFTNSYYAGLPAGVLDDRGVTISNTWDGLNRLTSIKYPDGTTVSNVYTRLDLTATKDRLGNWNYFSYDGLRHLTNAINANGGTNQYIYCGCGSLNEFIDALNNPTYFSYDNQGNLTNALFPDFTSLTWQYDLARRMTNVFDGLNRFLRVTYNNQGLATNIATANGKLQSATFDALNRPIIVTDANGVSVTNVFDSINHLLKSTWPDGIGEGFGYTAAGLVAYTNRDGKATYYNLDTAGRILGVTNANSEIVRAAYDSLDNITDLWDGNTNHTRWQFNEYGWLTNKIDGLNRNASRYAYNVNGWATNRWTPEKGNSGFSYDNIGNLKTVAYPQISISYFYDALNRLTNMVDALGSHTFTWTPGSQLASESDSWTTVNFTNVQGLRTAMSIQQGGTNWTQRYGFDSAWRMTNTVSPAGAFSYQFLTPNSYLPTSISLPNGVKIVNGYDSLARMTNTVLNNYWNHTLDGYAYQHDPLGLTTNIQRNLGLTTNSVTVGFDNIGQITGWTATEPSGISRLNEQLSFVYDAAHNLRTRTQGNLTQTFTVNAANELTNVSRAGTYTLTGATPAPTIGVTVNGQAAQRYGDLTFAATNLTLANGNNTFTVIATNAYGVLTTNITTASLPTSVTLNFDNNSSLTNDGALLYGYDSENQLTNITLFGSWKSDFTYDGLNRRRIERDYLWNGSSWTKTNEIRFIYDGYLPIQERDSNNVPKVTYTRGLDFSGTLQGAGGVCGLLARSDAAGTVFYHADAVGNVTALMDGSENIVGRYLYGPSGNLLAMSGPMAFANVMRAFSAPVHPLSGLLHLPFRDLNARIPIFLTADPLGEGGGLSLHGFAANNALRYVDPWGWQAEERDVKPGEQAPETRSPLERLLPNGERRPSNYEDRLQEQLERESAAQAMRLKGLDPNQTYIGPRPEDNKPSENQKPCPEGSFSIRDWTGYPNNLPKPAGPFRLLSGQEYNDARNAANRENQRLHREDPDLEGKQIHEIQPVKFGGSPTDPNNKIPLTSENHAPATVWWNQLRNQLQAR